MIKNFIEKFQPYLIYSLVFSIFFIEKIKYKSLSIYEFILNKFKSKSNFIITNKNYTKLINRKFKIYKIKETNSMFETVENSIKFFK